MRLNKSNLEDIISQSQVLVVEDYPAIQKAYVDALTEAGFQVAAANNGQQALDLLAHNAADVIILDLIMPGMDGLDFLQAYNASTETRAKVMMMTNMDSPDLRKRALDLGAIAYLDKATVMPHDLVGVIRDALGKKADPDPPKPVSPLA